MWLFWDLGLMLFDISKDLFFPKILLFYDSFGFPVVNWTQKWTNTVNFVCVPFEPKLKILKDFSNTVS